MSEPDPPLAEAAQDGGAGPPRNRLALAAAPLGPDDVRDLALRAARTAYPQAGPDQVLAAAIAFEAAFRGQRPGAHLNWIEDLLADAAKRTVTPDAAVTAALGFLRYVAEGA